MTKFKYENIYFLHREIKILSSDKNDYNRTLRKNR